MDKFNQSFQRNCNMLDIIFDARAEILASMIEKDIDTIKCTTDKTDSACYNFKSSIVFVVGGLITLCTNETIPIWMKGLRFSATHSLASTLLVFAIVLMPLYKKGTLTNEVELFKGISEKNANLLLHYICPILSIISFLLFERNPALLDSQWTLYAALPSIIYWVLYFLLTMTNCWEEPYGFTQKKETNKTNTKGVLFLLLIPIMSVGMDYLLWWINTL